MRNKTLHIVEFDDLADGVCARMLKWCTTCCFHRWNTHYKQGVMQFHFWDRYDAERFVMRWSELMYPRGPDHWDDEGGMT